MSKSGFLFLLQAISLFDNFVIKEKGNLAMEKHALFFVVFTVLLSCCNKTNNGGEENKETDPDEGRVILHSEVQRVYLSGPLDKVNLYARGAEELSRPLTPTFTWEEAEGPYTVYLADNPNYIDMNTYTTDEAKISFSNLKINTKYYYDVRSNGKSIKEDSFVTSAQLVRNLYISGVTNARDIGGYATKDGVSKQGVLFRTGRLNKNDVEEVDVRITSKGIEAMHKELKVKTEIDLRMVENNEVGGLTEGLSVLGNNVKYYQCPMDYNKGVDASENDPSLRKVFSILGNKDNYPAFFHCSIGTDRTGYVAWLINSIVGVGEEDLWRDYLFSNFGNIGGSRDKAYIADGYPKKIKETEGDTLQEKAVNFLLKKGIKQQEIDTIREMMLGQA